MSTQSSCDVCSQDVNTNRYDQLLIQYFQDSLTGAALRWYMGLESASIRSFNDLGEAFVKQYKYNVDMNLDRTS